MARPYKRNIFQRILGICATPKPKDDDCWSYADGKATVDLSRAPELDRPGSSVRLEGRDCPERILIVYGDDDLYHAYQNKCRHAGRRLDPVPGEEKLMCCSVSKSAYDYEGKIMAGPAKERVKVYPLEVVDGKLIIDID